MVRVRVAAHGHRIVGSQGVDAWYRGRQQPEQRQCSADGSDEEGRPEAYEGGEETAEDGAHGAKRVPSHTF
jgi:hypothetical protein